MIIASEFITEAQISDKILGLNPMIFLAICLAVLGLLFLIGRMYYLRWEHNAFIKESTGKILTIFHKKDTEIYKCFCSDFQGKAVLPKEHSAITFGLPDSLKPPPGHTIDKYLVFADHIWLDWYPDRLPRNRQIQVKTINYYENIPHPILPHDPDEWKDPEKYISMSTALYTQAADEATAESALKRMSGYLKVVEDIVSKIGKLGIMFICSIAGIALTIVVGFIAYQAMSKAEAILKTLQIIQGTPK